MHARSVAWTNDGRVRSEDRDTAVAVMTQNGVVKVFVQPSVGRPVAVYLTPKQAERLAAFLEECAIVGREEMNDAREYLKTRSVS